MTDEHYKILNFQTTKKLEAHGHKSKTIRSLCKAETLEYFPVFWAVCSGRQKQAT
jgi:hypothetical protein